jgi:dihydrofolate reductase
MDSAVPVQAIAAVAANRVIGSGGRLPWSLAADWRHFMQRTEGGVLIMGRTSFEDMLNEPRWAMDGREYRVISRDMRFAEMGPVQVLSTPQAALASAIASAKPVWVCGGAAVYRELLTHCDRLWLTRVQADFEGDTYFPEWQATFSRCRELGSGEDNGLPFTFTVWDRLAK